MAAETTHRPEPSAVGERRAGNTPARPGAGPPVPDGQRPARREANVSAPPFRRLRVYAFDPSLATQMETAVVNVVTLKVPWESNVPPDLGPEQMTEERETRELLPGPVGEYIEVVDYDPASGCFYAPVDLNDLAVVAQDGLPPSEGDPRFHQQMVYAVAMKTIQHFERALGRIALWSPRKIKDAGGTTIDSQFVRRLRIYPHALREPNAYYSPDKKALLFGYFPASRTDPGGHLPGGMVFTCLSHDVIAHETTHALLDGLHARYVENSNPDVLAFHEAFADVVALFQHFTMPEVLRHQIAKARGDLAGATLLGDLARQFGHATGRRAALRSAIGRVNKKTGVPDPTELSRITEPHDRGAILMAAVFDAFVSIYRSRAADLIRIATGGTGVLADGELHPDLVNRLADEASRAASHVLNMCIRALDYCPPVDLTFGEYLRALITADADLVPDDDLCYRVAFIEAFRRRGIYPPGLRTLSEESLRWRSPERPELLAGLLPPREELKRRIQEWDMTVDRRLLHQHLCGFRGYLHNYMQGLEQEAAPRPARMTEQVARELRLDPAIRNREGRVRFEVHSARPARRIGPDGQQLIDLVIVLTQRREEYFTAPDADTAGHGDKERKPDFLFRGGCTLLVDLDRDDQTCELRGGGGGGAKSEDDEPKAAYVRYTIVKNMASAWRLNNERRYRQSRAGRSLRATYFGPTRPPVAEPFALLHRAQPEAADE
jgi:hypothetical protein